MINDRSLEKHPLMSSQASSQTTPSVGSTEPVEALATPIVEIIRATKDELNLVEHPFAVMWNKEDNAVIHHEWEARHPATGKVLQASWRVTGDPEMGLPIPSDERVYLVLMELTREAGFSNQNVYFTRHDLLKRLGWPHNPRHYQMLYDAFDRLKSVTILAKNAFWDPQHKSFRNVGFSMLDNFDILNERPGRKKKGGQTEIPVSYFKWNDVIFQSFQSGYIRSLDLEFALSLKGDIALRLYRYLDKKSFNGRRDFEIEIGALCVRHLAMKEARYASTYRARLKNAHDELLLRGFLQNVEYSPMKTKKGEKVRYIFRSDALPTPSAPTPERASVLSSQSQLPLSQESANTREAAPENADAASLLARMTGIGVSPAVANKLFHTNDHDHLRLQLDCLADREAKSPAAVFVKAVREVWALPPAYISRLEAQERAQNERVALRDEEAMKTSQRAHKAALQASQDEEAARLDAAYAKLDELNRKRVDEEATKRLGIIGQMRSSEGAKAAMRRQVLREMLNAASS